MTQARPGLKGVTLRKWQRVQLRHTRRGACGDKRFSGEQAAGLYSNPSTIDCIWRIALPGSRINV